MNHDVMKKLRALAVLAYFKIHKNRFKKGVWLESAYDVDGERTWHDCSFDFLCAKLREETDELCSAIYTNQQEDIAYEAADVAALAMMIADRAGVLMVAESPTVVCLCGSSRFHEEFQRATDEETMAGRIVLSISFRLQSAERASGERGWCTLEQKLKLDVLHSQMIEVADEVLVLNVGGYIGESTANAIADAESRGKAVRYLEPFEN